jgi:hypothetical protein
MPVHFGVMATWPCAPPFATREPGVNPAVRDRICEPSFTTSGQERTGSLLATAAQPPRRNAVSPGPRLPTLTRLESPRSRGNATARAKSPDYLGSLVRGVKAIASTASATRSGGWYSGAKARSFSGLFSARLKSCPDRRAGGWGSSFPCLAKPGRCWATDENGYSGAEALLIQSL